MSSFHCFVRCRSRNLRTLASVPQTFMRHQRRLPVRSASSGGGLPLASVRLEPGPLATG